MTVEALIRAVTKWAAGEADIRSLVLVGSHARGEARSDSDVDLVILCGRPERYLEQHSWICECGTPLDVSIEQWGVLRSIRVSYLGGPEVEYGIAPIQWADLPLDDGTREVLKNGAVVLLDRDGAVTRATKVAQASA